MKKQILALAVAAVAAGSVHADIDTSKLVKVYGKANVSVENFDKENGADGWELSSNASRIGVKGETKLSEGLTAFYKFEYETFIDDGEKNDDQTFSQRNIVVGLKGGFGSIWGGKHDTPTKLAQKKVDLFNDLKGDIKQVVKGENRMSNIVNYTTPKIAGAVTVSLATILETEGDNSMVDYGFADSTSIVVQYDANNLYLALAQDSAVKDYDVTRLVGQYKFDKVQLGAMWQTAEKAEDGSSEQDSWHVSSKVKVGNGVALKAQYTVTSYDQVGQDDAKLLSLGVDKKLGKKTKAFAFFTTGENSKLNSYGVDADVFGFGMEHKF